VELRAYWSIIWRRIWIVALVVGVVALYVAFEANHLRTTPGALRGYQSTATLRFGFQSAGSDQNVNDYVTASESLADAFTTSPILTSNAFMSQIVQRVHADSNQIAQKFGPNADLGPLQDTTIMSKSLSSTRTHNIVTITVNWATPAGSWAIANATSELLTAHLDQYVGYVNSSTTTNNPAQVAAQAIGTPTDPQATTGIQFSRAILLALLLLVALIIGIALAFLVEYLSDHTGSQDKVAQVAQQSSNGVLPPASTPEESKPPV
jgi:capsular polysaccharide biosynthesis protein